MRFSSVSVCLAICAGVSACVTSGCNPPALFSDPESLDGQLVTECGFIRYEFENVNFYQSRRQAKIGEVGVGVYPGEVSDSRLREYDGRSVCLTGRVQYAGCTVTHICTGSNFVYQIVVDDVRLR